MKVHDMIPSAFLKQTDVGDGALLIVTGIRQENVAMQGTEPEYKWCLEFKGVDKPLVLNPTNMRLMEGIMGSDETDDWIGKEVVLYTDPTISFGGKITGGIRVRAPQNQNPPAENKPRIGQPVSKGPIPF